MASNAHAITAPRHTSYNDFNEGLHLEEAGWEHVPGDELPRDEYDVIVEDWACEALHALKPELADEPGCAELVVHELNQAVLDAHNGLVRPTSV